MLCKYVKHCHVAAWEAEGWRNAGQLPGHHAYWSVLMTKEADDFSTLEGIARANARQRAAGLESLPSDRKSMPIASGLLGYFPDACAYVAYVSKVGNDQHNPGKSMFWRRGASTDHANCLVRHQVEFQQVDDDNLLHAGKVAWRAMAQLQMLIEARRKGVSYADYIEHVQKTEG